MRIAVTTSKDKMLVDFACPHCGACEGPVCLESVLFFYCRAHKTKWIGGYDKTIEVDSDEQARKYNESGIGEFTYVDSSEGDIPGYSAADYYAGRIGNSDQ
jgi:hypothetical protein